VTCWELNGPVRTARARHPDSFSATAFPAEVLVHCGVPYLVREPDTSEELLRKQRIVRMG
jgi:hypothetical protein